MAVKKTKGTLKTKEKLKGNPPLTKERPARPTQPKKKK